MLGLDADRIVIRKLWIMLAHINGDVLNYTTLSRSLGLTAPTVKRYLSFLEDAFLIKILQPFSTNLKKRLVKSPKVYIRDTGMLHYLLNINSFNDLMSNPSLGGSWEGYVIEQITQQVNTRLETYYYRTQVGAECDLVIAKANIVLASIEIKFTSAPKTAKGMLHSFEDLNAKQNFIITPKTDDYMLTKSIRVCSLEAFLLNYLPTIING
jgi:predicted AAA+ superfamily ATPase